MYQGPYPALHASEHHERGCLVLTILSCELYLREVEDEHTLWRNWIPLPQLCLLIVWWRTESHFSFSTCAFPSHVWQAHNRWLHTDFIHSSMSSQSFCFSALASFFITLLSHAKCQIDGQYEDIPFYIGPLFLCGNQWQWLVYSCQPSADPQCNVWMLPSPLPLSWLSQWLEQL